MIFMEEWPEKSPSLEISEGSNGIHSKPFTEEFRILENSFIC